MTDSDMPRRTRAATFRTDVHGLRAVGIVLIVVFHVWVGKVSGGVDVLFVLTGFFATASLARGLAAKGPAAIPEYWSRTVARLLPTAALVAGLVFLAAVWVVPISQWESLSNQALASLLQVENWYLRQKAVDYLTRDEAPSVFQHFWALSIQFQFYLLYPVLLLVANSDRVARAVGLRHGGRLLAATLSLLAVLSFAYALWRVELRPAPTYFDSIARGWEFMAGALAALAASSVRLNARIAAGLAWLGLGMIMAAGVVVPVTWPYPGVAALVPVSGAVLFLLFGGVAGGRGPARVLSRTPFQRLADISYPLYLWHWPVLVVVMHLVDDTTPDLATGVAVIAASVVLALGTVRLDARLRRDPDRPDLARAFAPTLAVSLVVAAAVLVWRGEQRAEEEAFIANPIEAPADPIEAVQSAAGPALEPQLVAARNFLPEPYVDGCNQEEAEAQLIVCSYGSRAAGAPVVALVGGSHSTQWFPALEPLAHQIGFRLVTLTKDGCTLGGIGVHESCAPWSRAAMARLLAMRPDVVFTTSTRPADDGEPDVVPPEYRDVFQTLAARGIKVVAVRDNPWSSRPVPDCVASNLDRLTECAEWRPEVLAPHDPAASLAASIPGVTVLDLSEYLCTDVLCPAVDDDTLIYRDQHHLSVQYARSLAPVLEPAIRRELPPRDHQRFASGP